MTTTEEEAQLAGPGGLFAKIRAHVPTPQGQGQVFERLVKAFLTYDPTFESPSWTSGYCASGRMRIPALSYGQFAGLVDPGHLGGRGLQAVRRADLLLGALAVASG